MKLFPAAAFAACAAFAAAPLFAQDVLRGQVVLEFEPVYGFYADEVPEGMVRLEAAQPPLDLDTARRRAEQEAAMLFGAMIYGWSFRYEIGERARNIPEELFLESLGEVRPGDPRFQTTDVHVKELRLYLWADYHPDAAQHKRRSMWKAGTTRPAQALGQGSLGDTARPRSDGQDAEDGAALLAVKRAALEDAARAAIRAMLRASERNRPKEASGYISLAAFPRFFLDKGRWNVSARFFIALTGITPFAVH
jgi:hypothetical protein